MQSVDDQGHDVAALTRAVTMTPLTGLPPRTCDTGSPPTSTSATTGNRRPSPYLDGQDEDTTETAPESCHLLRGNEADAPTLTKRGMPSL